MKNRSIRFVSLGAIALLAGCHSTPAQPPRAAQQYSQALQMMKSNRLTDAELEFKQLSVAYPQFAGPQLNLGRSLQGWPVRYP